MIFWCIGLIIAASSVISSIASSTSNQSLNFKHAITGNERDPMFNIESSRSDGNEHADSKHHTPKYKFYFGRTHDGDHYRHQHKSEWLNGNQWADYHWPFTKQRRHIVQHTITADAQSAANRLQLPFDDSQLNNANATNVTDTSNSAKSNFRWMRANVASQAHSNRDDELAIHTKRHSKRKHRGSFMQLIDTDKEMSRGDSSFDSDMHHTHHHGSVPNTNRMTSKLYANADESGYSNVSNIAGEQFHWPIKKEAIVEGDLILGGLMMVHSRSDLMMCGPIMPQGT